MARRLFLCPQPTPLLQALLAAVLAFEPVVVVPVVSCALPVGVAQSCALPVGVVLSCALPVGVVLSCALPVVAGPPCALLVLGVLE